MDDELEKRIDEGWDVEHGVPIPIGRPLRGSHTYEHGVKIPLGPQEEEAGYIIEHGMKLYFD